MKSHNLKNRINTVDLANFIASDLANFIASDLANFIASYLEKSLIHMRLWSSIWDLVWFQIGNKTYDEIEDEF